MRISSHIALKRFAALAPIARIPGASLFLRSPSRRRPRISAKVRPRPLIISWRNRKNSGEGCGVVVAETRCQHRRGRWPAAQERANYNLAENFAVDSLYITLFAIIGSTWHCTWRSGGGPVGDPSRMRNRMKPDQPAAALVSCTVTFGAAKRISAAAKASIRRRSA